MSRSPAPPSLYDLDRPALEAFLAGLGQPRYRANQVWAWLYRRFAADYEAMTDLPAGLRRDLAARARLHTLDLTAQTESGDGLATKYLFRLDDGQLIETVLMHYLDPGDEDGEGAESPGPPDSGGGEAARSPGPADSGSGLGTRPSSRHTVCLSTQAGCAMGCVFCATGQMGLLRDLRGGECVEQLVYCARRLQASGARLSNVVFMGMGEPLANWEATWHTVQVLVDPEGFGLSPRRLTVSTVGIVPGIRRLAECGLPLRLAVSLHAPDDALRGELVGINATYGLDAILAACRDYQAITGRRITIEYVLIDGINDRPAQAEALAKRLRGLHAHVNLIPLNPTAGSPMRPSPYRRAVAFERVLRRAGFSTTLRMRRGIDIQAGCGQLRSRAAEGRLGRSVAPRTVALAPSTAGDAAP